MIRKKRRIAGIDVHGSRARILELGTDGGVHAYGVGAAREGNVNGNDSLAQELVGLIQNTRPNALNADGILPRVVMSLPESKLFTHFVEVSAPLKGAEYERYVLGEAEKMVPMNFDELCWSYCRSDEGATFVAVRKDELEAYIGACSKAGIHLVCVGGELFTLGRVLLPEDASLNDYLLITAGKSETVVGVFRRGAVHLSIQVPYGEQQLSETLPDGTDGAGITELLHVVDEAKRFHEERAERTLTGIIVSGTATGAQGIAARVSRQLGIAASVGDPLAKIADRGVFSGESPEELAMVVGLALHDTERNHPHINLLSRMKKHGSMPKMKTAVSSKAMNIGRRLMNTFSGWYRRTTANLHVQDGVLRTRTQRERSKLALTATLLIAALSFLTWVCITYL